MKHTQTIQMLAAAALAALSLGSASATVTYVTGATSFEAVTDNALKTFATNNFGNQVTWDNATFGKETNEIFTWGPDASHVTNQIIVHWYGSEGVVQTLSAPTNNPVTLPFYPTNAATGLVSGTNATDLHSPQWGMYDNYQTTSVFYKTGAGDGNYYSPITDDTKIAAESYAIIANTNWPSSVTNITTANLRSLYTQGGVALALITGNPADQTNTVFAVGRNPDGGTRAVTFAETQIGSKFNGAQQYQFISSNDITLWPTETIDGISTVTDGNSGYATDGALRGIFTNTLADGPGIDDTGSIQGSTGHNYIIGYTSVKNATGSPGVVILNFNGVAPTTQNIENGSYTLWAFAHIGVSPNYADATATSIAHEVISLIQGYSDSQLGAGNAKLTNLKVTRTADGGIISQTY